MEHTGLLFLFTCQPTKSSNFSRSGVNVRAHLLRKNYSRNFSANRKAPRSEIRVMIEPLNCLSPPVIFNDRSKAVLLLWIFLLFTFHVCLYNTALFVPFSLVITCLERTDLLAPLKLMFPCVLLLFHMVSRVRCGTCLYWFLIFAFFFTSAIHCIAFFYHFTW